MNSQLEVAFGPTEEKKLKSELEIKATENFIISALKQKKTSSENQYLSLVEEIRIANEGSTIDTQVVSRWLVGFIRHISLLHEKYQNLVEQVLKLNWAAQDDKFAELFHQFAIHLVSAHPIHVPGVITMISSYFLKPNKLGQTSKETAKKRLHLLLKEVITLVPTSTTYLCQSLTSSIPHKWESVESHLSFTEHLLLVSRYIPMLRDQLLTALMNRIVQLDSEIQIEVDELKEVLQEEVHDEVFHLELDEKSDEENSDSDMEDSDSAKGTKRANPRTIEKTVQKLDGMLNLVLEHIRTFDFSQQEGFGLFYCMVHIFNTSIIRTFKSRHAQFVLFYLCSLQRRFSDAFLGVLFDHLISPDAPRVTRIASAAYLSSFTARAKFLEVGDIRKVASLLLNWLESYMESTPTSDIRLDYNSHALFYAVTQAMLYLFCFRWRTFRDPSGEWNAGIVSLRHILHSSFRPLKFCNPQLVEQFSQLSQQLGFMYCYSIIERDNRLNLPSSGGLEKSEVESFFPFDPYKLDSSSHFFEDIYFTWDTASALLPSISIQPTQDEDMLCESFPSPLMTIPNLSPSSHIQPRVIKKVDTLAFATLASDSELDLGSPMLGLSLSPMATAHFGSQRWAQG